MVERVALSGAAKACNTRFSMTAMFSRGCHACHRIAVCLTVMVLSGGAAAAGTFSQYPGFADYFAQHPRSSLLPTDAEQNLLRRHRPHWMLPPGHPGAVSFYDDYIANGVLVDGNGAVVSDRVTAAILNAHGDDPRATFTHRRPHAAPKVAPVVFARIDHERFEPPGHASRCLTLLTYHVVFRTSGLPAGLGAWSGAALGLLFDLDDWHQLDHYTAATVVLDERAAPVMLRLQQHNHQRTWVLGVDLPVPVDGRPVVDVAIRSNELYPHAPGRVRHRSVPFPTPEGMRYLLGFGPAPTMSADDITDGRDEADYPLGFLPHDDAFYSFQGWLGERRRLPGRDGPPGADYNTLPPLKPASLQLAAGYWREGNRDDLAAFEAGFTRETDIATFAGARRAAVAAALERVSAPSPAATAACDWSAHP